MADPAVVQCTDACTVTVLVDWSTVDLLNIDPTGGAQISVAIALVWAVGWAIRQIIRLVQKSGETSTEES